jgi:hypothetical protein
VRHKRAGATKLHEAIDAHKNYFDQSALKSLARLANNPDAARAFERLKLNDSHDIRCFFILRACVLAEQLARDFPQLIAKTKRTLARTEQLDKTVAELRGFIAEVAVKKDWSRSNPFSVIIRDELGVMRRGLKLIAREIEAKRFGAKEAIANLGVTRKARSEQAAENAAIWYLGKEVLLTLHKAYTPVVAELSQVILGPEAEVDVERVRRLIRNRRQQYGEMFIERRQRGSRTLNEMFAKLSQRSVEERQQALKEMLPEPIWRSLQERRNRRIRHYKNRPNVPHEWDRWCYSTIVVASRTQCAKPPKTYTLASQQPDAI